MKPSKKKPTAKRVGRSLAELMRATAALPEATFSVNWNPDPVVPIQAQEPPPLRNRVEGFTAKDAEEIARTVVATAKEVAGGAGMVPRGRDCYWRPTHG